MGDFKKFEALSSEKKKMIINVAMKEFLKGGYDKASMNALVEAAGISKGSLFYYFDNKKSLYLYLLQFCQDMIFETAAKSIIETDKDFISRISRNIEGNVYLLREYPLSYKFLNACKVEKSEHVVSDILEIKKKSADALFAKLYKNIDISLFREGLDLEMAVYSIKTTMFQIVHDHLSKNAINDNEVFEHIQKCAEFFRKALYE